MQQIISICNFLTISVKFEKKIYITVIQFVNFEQNQVGSIGFEIAAEDLSPLLIDAKIIAKCIFYFILCLDNVLQFVFTDYKCIHNRDTIKFDNDIFQYCHFIVLPTRTEVG